MSKSLCKRNGNVITDSLSKAEKSFDTVSHDGILSKLQQYSIDDRFGYGFLTS